MSRLSGLGEFLFYDMRKNEDGTDKPHPLNDPRFPRSDDLVLRRQLRLWFIAVGATRREAIQKFGVRAIVAEGFAEIFFGNCITLGIPCLTASREDIARITAAIESDPHTEIVVDVAAPALRWGEQSARASIRESARDALVNGRWDAIGELAEGLPAVVERAKKLPYMAV